MSSVEGRREKIAAWLQSRRISAVRAASQTITYQGMVAELDKRVEAVQQATLYEVNLRNREQVKTYLRRTDGLARLTKLVDSNPERAMRKPFKEFEAELQAVRIWSEMVRVQETRLVVRECDWLGALMDDVEESLRAGVCTETEKILMSAVLQRVIEGLEFLDVGEAGDILERIEAEVRHLFEPVRAAGFRGEMPFHHFTGVGVELVGGGLRVKPGEVSLAHLGVLFLDELPEFAGIR